MNKIWVKPGDADRRVPHPSGGKRYFPQDVATEVRGDDPYIQRRLAEGDLVEAKPPVSGPSAPVAPEPEPAGLEEHA